MSKHEKNPHGAARQDRDIHAKQTDDEVLEALEGSEELLKTSFTAGNEMKIAVAVIAVLLVVFAAAVVKWMRNPSGSASKSDEQTVANRDAGGNSDNDKAKPERPDKSPFSASNASAKPTVVTAVPGPGAELKSTARTGESDTWTFASDAKSKPAKTQDERSPASPPSFGSRMAAGGADNRATASADRNSPRPSFGGWNHDTDVRAPAANQQPSDPFRSRAAVDGLRRDSASTAGAAASSANASKRPPPSEAGRPFQAVPNGLETPSFGLADTSKPLPRPGDVSLPSAASRSPRVAGDPNPLRTPDLASASQGSASLSSTSPRRPTDTGLNNVAPASATGVGRPADATYVVQFDENYWNISLRLFGTGGYSRALAKHNEKTHREDKLKAGDVILAPSAAELERLYPELCPSPARPSPAESQPRTASTMTRPDGRRTYVVQDGDTLYDIARRELGKAARWAEIYDLNKDLINKHWLDLAPGTQILLPDAEPGSISQRPGAGSLR